MKLGPDPNRSYLQRHNEMKPSRYGNLNPEKKAQSKKASEEIPQTGAGSGAAEDEGGLFLTFQALAITIAVPVLGVLLTILIGRAIAPDHLTVGWVFGYVALFAACTGLAALVATVMSRVLGVLLIAGLVALLCWGGWTIASLF